MTFVCDHKKLYDHGEIIFKRYVLDHKIFLKVYRCWEHAVDEFEKMALEINTKSLSKLEIEKLSSLFLEFSSLYSEKFWYHGLVPEIANWGGEQLLVKELRKKIRKEDDFIYALERL